MNTCTSKILFLHGLDSSRESTKFHAIHAVQKFCIDVDYRNLNYQTVASFYHDIIHNIKPEILVGHSLGAYWALKMSSHHKIPAIIANPSLHPDFRSDYPPISEEELENDIPQLAYIELGDEILDMYEVVQQIEPYMQIQALEGGHHRLSCPENLNHLIQYTEEHFLKK
ncbi:esterase [Acinetobacter chinensis]|uniref:Esterase n=1 Tax=Acinetobacter chinensis TaxID=2004650 RepID=A0A3B7LZI3_9GAMM|nr:YqiA/YcfP family alpha/beta fold hydrolase [Acinetobacter chinensis]AXY57435.1 esterase [Acinetobacter chinensis]MDV2467663.1 YqiA/YcfP family alpha/beta fold hydrolase [Acinetobacter chinensis]WOE40787.1 YqiA/YcfP family alpha/beta fold hydrolase [Acinetobacter chinensis]